MIDAARPGLADPKEIDEIAYWFPEVAQRIHDRDHRGLPNRWGRNFSNVRDQRQAWLPLCRDCQTRWDTLL